MKSEPSACLERRHEHHIDRCRCCGLSHDYTLSVRYWNADSKPKVFLPLFGGTAGPVPAYGLDSQVKATTACSTWQVFLICPTIKREFVESVTIELQAGETIVRVAVPEAPIPDAAPPTTSTYALASKELEEWTKASATVARDFCKTMLTTSTGAIPVLFGVLKYLGLERANGALMAALGIITSGLFLCSAIIFIVALRPRYLWLSDPAEFAEIRARRFRRMNRLIGIGTVIFLLGVGASIGAFGIALGS